MRKLHIISLVILLLPICQAQEMDLNCILMIDQRLPENVYGKCFFGENSTDSIDVAYHMGHLTFIDVDRKFEHYLETRDSNLIRLCFDIERLLGGKKIGRIRYSTGYPSDVLKTFIKNSDELLVFNIITLNKKKDKYLFYMKWGSMSSVIKEKKGKKIHWNTFVYPNTYF